MIFPSLPKRIPPRMPAGTPANFKGIPDGKEEMQKFLNGAAGGVAFDPVPAGPAALSVDFIKKMSRRLKGFLGLDSFEFNFRNKFTLRGAANFTGEYPPELVAERQRLAASQVRR